MTDIPTQPAWYCVRAQPKSEHIAANHLRLIPGVEVYCPRLRFRRPTQRGPVWFSEALFPGYLFARFVPMASQKEIASTRAVSTIVRFGEELARIPDANIEDLREHMGAEECKTLDAEVREGDTVTITAGVFQGLSTVVSQLLPANERVRVLVDFLGQCREVEVEKSDLLPERNHLLSI